MFYRGYHVLSCLSCFIVAVMFYRVYHVLSWLSCFIVAVMFYRGYHVLSWLSCFVVAIMFYRVYHVLSWLSCFIVAIMFYRGYHVLSFCSQKHFVRTRLDIYVLFYLFLYLNNYYCIRMFVSNFQHLVPETRSNSLRLQRT